MTNAHHTTELVDGRRLIRLDDDHAIIVDRSEVKLHCYDQTHGAVSFYLEDDGTRRAIFEKLAFGGAPYAGRTAIDCRGDRCFASLSRADLGSRARISAAARRAILSLIAAAESRARRLGWLDELERATRCTDRDNERAALVAERAKLVERLAEIDRLLSRP